MHAGVIVLANRPQPELSPNNNTPSAAIVGAMASRPASVRRHGARCSRESLGLFSAKMKPDGANATPNDRPDRLTRNGWGSGHHRGAQLPSGLRSDNRPQLAPSCRLRRRAKSPTRRSPAERASRAQARIQIRNSYRPAMVRRPIRRCGRMSSGRRLGMRT